ncbi:Pleckstrin-2 [Chelonia mydas]|uniref:Pleckstrin-2 n=1 Tax=Chelonia mydas TaxID=8469 RepID=M7C8M8_CHEMY|nr:Pleckstrin-2 [Chelonia mydas]
MKNSFKLPSNISLNHIVDKMHDNSNGIKLTHNMEQGNTYKESFTGSALVDWLISSNFVASRFEAVTLASMLMEENFTKPVGVRSTEAMRNGDLAEQFLDDSTALYMFAESYKRKLSSREELHLHILELSGTIVKQGYLVKQEENRPVGGFSLRGCLVSALEDNGVPTGVKGNVQGNLFKIITKNDIHYYIQASSKAERAQWIEAIKRLT